jgi:hypothetical protein
MKLISYSGNTKIEERMNSNVVCDLVKTGYYAIFKIPFRNLGQSTPFIVNDFME